MEDEEEVDNPLITELSEVQSYSEIDNGAVHAGVNVKGRLRRHLDFWKRIGAPEYILSVIRDGYRLPFVQFPPRKDIKNNKSASMHSVFVQEAINELITSGRVLEVDQVPWVVNPLSVAIQSSGKKRLILDLRHVNRYLEKQHIKYEDWKVALSYFHKGAYMISFDLKSGYHHIDIHPDHQTFLGFAWKFPNCVSYRYFIFTVLPFGLSTAPHIFTKTLKPIVKYWRFNGINLGLFLDDGWLIESDQDTCSILSKNIKSDLDESGLISSDPKCQWEPCQIIEWLGLVWNSIEGTIKLTDRRIQSIIDAIDNVSKKKYWVSCAHLGFTCRQNCFRRSCFRQSVQNHDQILLYFSCFCCGLGFGVST